MRKFHQIGTSIACELRIGNYVKCDSIPEVGILKISVINKDFVNGCNIELIKPIPLTEEWLLKFVFDKNLNFHSSVGYSIKDFTIWMYTVNEFTYGKTTIEHVHQLQNLYFALTNEELELTR